MCDISTINVGGNDGAFLLLMVFLFLLPHHGAVCCITREFFHHNLWSSLMMIISHGPVQRLGSPGSCVLNASASLHHKLVRMMQVGQGSGDCSLYLSGVDGCVSGPVWASSVVLCMST